MLRLQEKGSGNTSVRINTDPTQPATPPPDNTGDQMNTDQSHVVTPRPSGAEEQMNTDNSHHATQRPRDMEDQMNTEKSHHVTPRSSDKAVRLNWPLSVTTKRRHSEPGSLFKCTKTLRKCRWSSRVTRRVKRSNSEAGTRWTPKRPTWGLFGRKRSPSEPLLYPGQRVKNRDDVIMNIYELFCGNKTNGINHDGENDNDNDVDVDRKTQDEKQLLIGHSSYALRWKATPRYSHHLPFSLHGNVHGKKRKRKLQRNPLFEQDSRLRCLKCQGPGEGEVHFLEDF